MKCPFVLRVFSGKSDSRIANVHLSVCLSITVTPLPLRIAPIIHRAYLPLSLSTIEPIDHRAYRPSSLSTIEPIKHRTYQPSSLSTIKPSNLWYRLLSLLACSKTTLKSALSVHPYICLHILIFQKHSKSK